MSAVIRAMAAHALRDPDAIALSDASQAYTYQALAAEIGRAADLLRNLAPTVRPGAPVGIVLENGPAWVILDLALVELGWPCVPIPAFFTPGQQAHALATAGVGLLITRDQGHSGVRLDIAGCNLRATSQNHPAATLPDGTAKVTFTSGSTATPKGVCLSQAQMESVASSLVQVLGAEPAERHLPILPLPILLENVAGLYATLLAGGRYHVLPPAMLGVDDPFRPDMPRLMECIAAERASSLILPPELLSALLMTMEAADIGLPSLRLVAVGGAKVASQLLDRAARLGLPAYEGYGLSECGSVVALNTPAANHIGTVGRVLPHLTFEIAPDGEIVICSPTFLGYVGEPLQTGPLRTGDLGGLDAEGFLRIEGRRANTIINAHGRNIAPEWVESELLAQPEIQQAVVFGEGQPELGALIVPLDSSLDQDAISRAVARANANLPGYAQVRRWRVRGPFDHAAGELTGNGRPRRKVLLDRERGFVEAFA